jgi:small subunit ribosomal protein S17
MAENETEVTDTTEQETAEQETAEAETTSAPVASTPVPKAKDAAGDEAARGNHRKVREGIVVSTGMEKTAVVAVTDRVRHARYAKTVQRTRKFYVHDEENSANKGDRVSIAETRPLSKTKRWRLVQILERAR